jgi:plasmid replication initiation protein
MFISKDSLPSALHSKTPKVYKNKKLNTANFGDFTHHDYYVFLHLLSKIGGVDKSGKYLQPEQLQRQHTLNATEFSELFNIDVNNSYGFLNKACKKLMKTSIIIERIELNGTCEINVCSSAEYNKNKGSITIKFTDDIMPYLAQASQKFMLYNLKEIANFSSLYTTRLFELLQEFKDTGYLIKSVIQLRESFAVGNSFKLYADFKRFTFAHACDEINSNYKINLSFEEVKEGRKVVAIKFYFKKTKIHKMFNQHTGDYRNFYEKPESKDYIKNSKKVAELSEPKIALSPPACEDAKSLQSVIASFLTKFPSEK